MTMGREDELCWYFLLIRDGKTRENGFLYALLWLDFFNFVQTDRLGGGTSPITTSLSQNRTDFLAVYRSVLYLGRSIDLLITAPFLWHNLSEQEHGWLDTDRKYEEGGGQTLAIRSRIWSSSRSVTTEYDPTAYPHTPHYCQRWDFLSAPLTTNSLDFRFPRSLFRLDQMRDRRARWNVGIGTLLRPLHLREIGHRRRGRSLPPVWAGRRLRPAAQSQPEMQALREDQQDRPVPELLSPIRMRTRRKTRIPRNSGRSHWLHHNHCQTISLNTQFDPDLCERKIHRAKILCTQLLIECNKCFSLLPSILLNNVILYQLFFVYDPST